QKYPVTARLPADASAENTSAGLNSASSMCGPTTKSHGPRVRGVRVDPQLRDRLLHGAGVELALLCQRVQCRDRDVLRVHLEESPQRLARLGAAEAVGA